MNKQTTTIASSLSSAQPASANVDQSTGGEFLNRELSWLEFNRRVLHEALDDRNPLLERVGFLAIFNSNLDEFYQKRVGGLKRQIQAGIMTRTPDGMTPQEQLVAISQYVLPMLDAQAKCFNNVIKPHLAEHGIHLLRWDELTEAEHHQASEYFRTNLYPILTPLAVDPGHPFPFISNLSLSLGVMLRNPEIHGDDQDDDNKGDGNSDLIIGEKGLQFARVKIPHVLPRWIELSGRKLDGSYRYVNLEQIIRHNLGKLFEGMEIVEVEPFRITRSADVDRDEEDVEDLLDLIEQELRDRRFAQVIRLEVDDEPYRPLNQFLIRELNLQEADVYEMSAEMDYTDLWIIHGLNNPELKYQPWSPVIPARLADNEADIFSIIRSGDILVHHPYESFSSSVERFLCTAVNDPKVMAIKQTLYRTSQDSPFIPELIRAAEAGKQVVCLVELKARFDEERNVHIAQQLERAGVHVVYGLMGLKTHTKTSLVVRQEADGMRTYAHIGTGNYNSKTALLYTDLGLFTCDNRLTDDLVHMFHYLTGRSVRRDFNHLLIAPINMRRRFVEMIDREISHCRDWHNRGANPADPNRPKIIAKMNSLEDRAICRKLYEASQHGVDITLIVRGFCCLRPGVQGMSENIRVISVIGRFLEHSRIYYFHNDGDGEYYIGSADWMYRNLNNRVECITPVFDQKLHIRLKRILDVMINDNRQAWDMLPDGGYVQRRIDPDNTEYAGGTHRLLMEDVRQEMMRAKLEQ